MKTRSWILMCLSVSLFFVIACEPYTLPTLQPTQTPGAEQPAQAEATQAPATEQPAQAEATQISEPEADIVMASLDLPAGGLRLTTGVLVLSGSGEPGSEVQVLVDDQVVGETEVGSEGSWTLETSVVEAGDHQLVVQTLAADGTVTSASEPVDVSVAAAELASEAPEFIFPIDGADLLMGQLTLVGYGQAGTEVELMAGTAVLGLAEVNPEGEWTYTFEPPDGEHQLAARIPGSETAMSNVVTVLVTSEKDIIDCDFSNHVFDRGDTYIVGTCDTLNEISQDLGLDLDVLIAVNPQLDPNLDLIYPGQILNLPQ